LPLDKVLWGKILQIGYNVEDFADCKMRFFKLRIAE
jgi:hypothetical protein